MKYWQWRRIQYCHYVILNSVVKYAICFCYQTPYSLFRDFGANKTLPTHWSGVSVQVWVQVLPLQVTWQSFLYSRRQSKVLTAKSMAELLLQRSCTARASKTQAGKYKQRVFPSLRQSYAVAARSNLHVWSSVLVPTWIHKWFHKRNISQQCSCKDSLLSFVKFKWALSCTQHVLARRMSTPQVHIVRITCEACEQPLRSIGSRRSTFWFCYWLDYLLTIFPALWTVTLN